MPVEEVDLRAAVEEGLNEPEPQEEVNEIEQDWTDEEAAEAEAMGWIPPDRAKKLPEGKKFVGPKEFMERNPLYRKMKQMESSFEQLNEHYRKVSETEAKKAAQKYEAKIAQLEEEKIKALDEGDSKRVVEIDKEILNAEKPTEPEKGGDPIFQSWVADNPWYEKDEFLQIEANKIGSVLYSDKLYGKALLEKVKSHLKEAYPDRFSNPKREKPSAVEGSSPPAPKQSKSVSIDDLTADERTVYTNFERMKVFKSKEDKLKYIKEVIDLRE